MHRIELPNVTNVCPLCAQVYLEASFIVDTITLLFLGFSVFPFHSPFFSSFPFLHLVVSMTAFSLLDVVLLCSAWIAVAFAFDLLNVVRRGGGGGGKGGKA